MKTLYVIAGNLREFDRYVLANTLHTIPGFSDLWYVASLRDLHGIVNQPDYMCIGSYARRRDWKELQDRLDSIGAKEFHCEEHHTSIETAEGRHARYSSESG